MLNNNIDRTTLVMADEIYFTFVHTARPYLFLYCETNFVEEF